MSPLPVLVDGEPSWALLLTDPLDIDSARAHWQRVTNEIRDAGRWTPTNNHAVTRLVMTYLLYERSAREVLEHGPVIKSPVTGVPQYSLHFTAMNKAAAVALLLEAELMLSPRKRGKAPMKSARGGTGGAGGGGVVL